MVQQRDVQGRIYTFKSLSECKDVGTDMPDIPDSVRHHMLLVLDVVPGRRHHVKIMAITSTSHENGEYIPITPTPKKGYPIQLRLQSHTVLLLGVETKVYPILGPTSFLKIDESYQVPIQVLKEATDNAGNANVILPRHQGGVAQLRQHVQQRDAVRAVQRIAVEVDEMTEQAHGETMDDRPEVLELELQVLILAETTRNRYWGLPGRIWNLFKMQQD